MTTASERLSKLPPGTKKVVWSPHPGRQTLFLKCPADLLLTGGAKGGGKGLRINEIIVTPYGLTTIGKLSIGSWVSNPDGTVSEVVGIFHRGLQPMFRITFLDRSTIDCDADHLWPVWLRAKKQCEKEYGYRVLPTSHMADIYKLGKKKLLVQVTNPIEFYRRNTRSEQFPLSVDPYTLGVLLGDGHLRKESVSFFSADEEIVKQVPYKVTSHKQEIGKQGHAYGVIGILERIRELGLEGRRAWEKFIPEAYLYATIKQRWELLRGLMDTDGTAHSGKIYFCTTSQQLADDVRWLVQSLGGIATITSSIPRYAHNGEKKSGRVAYKLYIKFRDPSLAFSLPRKKNKCRKPQGLYRRITKIEPIEPAETVCITTDHPNGLFLTKDFIVTHNSDSLLIFCVRYHKIPGKAIFFRKTYKELELHTIPRSQELFGKVAHWDGTNHRWIFRTPDGGQFFLYFAYLQYESDVFKYQGSEFPRIAFDESTFFSEQTIRYMVSCMRSSNPLVYRQMALGANPIGPGFGWHKEVFIKNRQPLKIYNDAQWSMDKKPIGFSTCFIPSRVYDNPTLMRNDPDYPKRLQTQYGAITEALLNGSWDQTMNMALDYDEAGNTCEPVPLKRWGVKAISIDYGRTDNASATWLDFDDRRVTAYRDYAVRGMDIKPFCKRVVDMSVEEDESGREVQEEITCVILSHELFADQGAGRTRADLAREIFEKVGWIVVPSGRDPSGRLMLAKEFMRREALPGNLQHGGTIDYDYWMERFRKEGVKAHAEYVALTRGGEIELLPRLIIFRGTDQKEKGVSDNGRGCPNLMRTLPLLVTKMGEPFTLEDGQEDDPFDSLTYGLRYYMGPVERPIMDLYRERMAKRMPDSMLAAEAVMADVKREVDEEHDEFKPVTWRSGPYDEKH